MEPSSMTEKQYINAGTLADHFEHWRHRLGSDGEASRQVQRCIHNKWLVCGRPLPADFKLTRIAGKIMVETRGGMSDAADYPVGRLPDPTSLKAAKPTPREQAAIEAMFLDKSAVEASAATPVATKPVPAPKPPREPRRKPVFKTFIQPKMETHAEEAGLFDTLDAAVTWTLQLLEDQNEEWVHPDTLEDWFKPYAGKWFRLGGKRRKLKGASGQMPPLARRK
jgi:hypothetical protein